MTDDLDLAELHRRLRAAHVVLVVGCVERVERVRWYRFLLALNLLPLIHPNAA